MIVRVRVVPNAKQEKIVEDASGIKVYVTAPATEGRANRALIKMLAGRYGVLKRQVRIVRGQSARHKVIEVNP